MSTELLDDDFLRWFDGIATEDEQGRFRLGKVLATPGAMDALEESGQSVDEFVQRHRCGDWGDLGEEDKAENEYSVEERLRIFSAYHTTKGEKIWVITEADRSSTTVLLPSEY
jgi:hypothetical protein